MCSTSYKVLHRFGLGLAVLAFASCGDGSDRTGPTGTFAVSAPGSLTVEAGTSGQVQLGIAWSGGFSEAVRLTLENHPDGLGHEMLTVSAGTTTVTLSFSVTVEVPAGTYDILACGLAMAVQMLRCTEIRLMVTPAPIGDLALTIDPASLTLAQGQTGTIAITIVRTAPFTGPVTLDVATFSNLPGVTFTFDPEVIPSGATTATATIEVAIHAPPKVYTGWDTLWITGFGGAGLRDDVLLGLTVVAAEPAP